MYILFISFGNTAKTQFYFVKEMNSDFFEMDAIKHAPNMKNVA